MSDSREQIVDQYCRHVLDGGAGDATPVLGEEAETIRKMYSIPEGDRIFQIQTGPELCRVTYDEENGATLLRHIGMNRWVGFTNFPPSIDWAEGELERDPADPNEQEGE